MLLQPVAVMTEAVATIGTNKSGNSGSGKQFPSAQKFTLQAEGRMQATFSTVLDRIANAIQTVATGDTPSTALTVQDLTKMGLNTTGVTTNTLATLLAAIAAKNNDGSETETLAKQSHYQQSELLIPAFTGLGAPYWQAEARAALFGMTRDTGRAELAAAALAAVAYQTRDLLNAMQQDGIAVSALRVDGGMRAGLDPWRMDPVAAPARRAGGHGSAGAAQCRTGSEMGPRACPPVP